MRDCDAGGLFMNEENYLMWLSRTLNCGLPKMWELIEYFGSAEEIYKAGKYDLLMAAGDRDGESLFEASKDGSIEKYLRLASNERAPASD